MPFPLTPPPPNDSGAFTVPRNLDRWLDVNPIGVLTRTSTYITLPTFNVANSWNGYSDIVASFNVESPNNISLTNYSIPASPNYAMCVSYITATSVVRYLLWDASGSNFNEAITPYTGQYLLKNFRFEVWNTSQGAVSEIATRTFYTSKLGAVDYRFGSDTALCNPDTVNTSFAYSSVYSPLSLPTTNLWADFIGSYGISNLSWSAKTGGLSFVGGNSGNISTTTDPLINGNTAISNGNTLLFTNGTKAATAIFGIWAVIKLNSTPNTNDVYFGLSTVASNFGGSFLTIAQSGTDVKVDGVTIASNLQTGVWYCMFIVVDFTNLVSGGYCVPVTSLSSEPVFGESLSISAAQPSVLTVGANTIGVTTVDMEIAEIVCLDTSLTPTIRSAVVKYLFSVYGPAVFNLPMIFPAQSISKLN